MDVSVLSPFTNVKCPECGEQTRVKCRLGNYELKKRQGVGGMSLVFGAVDLTLGREVAIKILNETYSMDEKRIAQFEQEAQITAGISHPHVVRVYTVGQAFNRFYIAMEMVAGGSLEQQMSDQGAMDESDIVSIATQVTEGLQAAQRAGLIHRDIKPGNILFDNEGHAKIVDFGLALVTQGGKAKAEEIWATPYYVPPEALDGDEEDFRGDMYALGASLYHALSGKPPFEKETKSTTELREIKRELPPLKKAAPWISDGLCAVIDRAMAFSPADRFESYEEMLSALKHYESYHQLASATGPVSARAKRRAQSQQNSKTWIWGAVGVAAVGIGVAYTFLSQKPEDTGADDNSAVVTPVENNGEVGEAKLRLIAAELSAARNLLRQRDYKAASNRLLKLTRDPDVPSETVYWAGVQSAIASWLDGRSADARSALGEVRSRQKKAGGAKSATDQKLDKATDLLIQFKPIQPGQLDEVKDDLDKMILFAAALKNWEQGVWDTAGNFFREFEKAEVSEDSEELKFYRSLVGEYLKDMELMKPFAREYKPLTIQEARMRQDDLERLREKLKTRGRAQFNVASLKDQLSRQIEGMEARLAKGTTVRKSPEPRVNPQNEWERVSKEVDSLVSRLEFAKASERLKKYQPDTNERKSWRKEMIYLTDSGSGFLAAVFRDLDGKEADYTVISRDGQVEYKSILGATQDGIEVSSEGEKRLLLWKDVSPSSMLALHNQITRTGLNDFEKNIRLEQAIAYAWLVGEKEKAQTAALKLGQENEDFQIRWDECMKVLK